MKKSKTKKIKTKPWTGITWFVDEVNGSDNNDGLSVESAFKTDRHAYLQCRPMAKDIIIVLPEEKENG
jgi:hypothetical protein